MIDEAKRNAVRPIQCTKQCFNGLLAAMIDEAIRFALKQSISFRFNGLLAAMIDEAPLIATSTGDRSYKHFLPTHLKITDFLRFSNT